MKLNFSKNHLQREFCKRLYVYGIISVKFDKGRAPKQYQRVAMSPPDTQAGHRHGRLRHPP